MDLLLHNPIADMPGPQFLVLFAAVATVVVAALAIEVRRLDPALDLEPLSPGFKLSTHELACLRGGSRGLLNTVLFDLWRRGFLEIVEGKWGSRQIARARNGPDPGTLDDYECGILAEFETPLGLNGLQSRASLWAQSKRRAGELESRLQKELLLMPDELRARARPVAFLAGMSLLGLAGYKLGVALEKGHHNIAFLIMATAGALIAVALAGRFPRLTRRGQDHLAWLREAFGTWSGQDAMTVMAVALLGFEALRGTPHADVWRTIGASCGGSSGGGGSCGGGGCGGGGCGGGCGGCGGCGG